MPNDDDPTSPSLAPSQSTRLSTPLSEFPSPSPEIPAKTPSDQTPSDRIPSEWTSGAKIIFFGIGNVGRQDDGLGIRFIENLETLPLPSHIGLEANYQLNAEDALTISSYDIVVFVDATMAPQAKAPFEIRSVQPSVEVSFSTHAMSMGSILAFCQQLYNKRPKAYLLAMPGTGWEMTAGLSEIMSPAAQANLKGALDSITSAFRLPPIPPSTGIPYA